MLKSSVRMSKRKKKGNVYAYCDIIAFAAILVYSNYFVYSPFVDAYTMNHDRISYGKDAGFVFVLVGWITTVITIFNMYRGGLFSDEPKKNQLRKVSFALFAISVIMLFLSFLFSSLIEGSTLKSMTDTYKLMLMNRLYGQYIIFSVYSLIRWLGRFDYYEYHYYEKGERYNISFFSYYPLAVVGLTDLIYGLVTFFR